MSVKSLVSRFFVSSTNLTAAALAYGLDKAETAVIAVYDLGGVPLVLSDAGVKTSEINEVVLVGGQTRAKVNKTLFGHESSKGVDSDKAVFGAVIQGGVLAGKIFFYSTSRPESLVVS
ncbi:hypothetical protein F5887DRAFT_1180697 [Amanita rubescens]|nr:hypothetical protein F5887DRAFT_1180697 [Amanita rubescens]